MVNLLATAFVARLHTMPKHGGPSPEDQFLFVRQQTQAPYTNLKEITEMSQVSPCDEMSHQIRQKGVADELLLAQQNTTD